MTKKPPKDRFQTLSKREKEVLQLVCQHNGYKKIGEQLFITESAVKSHMSHIYDKLELDELDRDERVLQIHNVYCPLFSEIKEPKKKTKNAQIVPVEPEPEPLAPEEEEIIDADEMALITYKPITITAGGKNNVDKPKKKRGCFKYILGFILGVACTIGAWQGWLYVKEIPVVVSIIEIINPDFIQEPEAEPAKAAAPYTQPVAEPTAAPTAKSEPKIQSQASEPKVTMVDNEENNTDEICELNDWCKQDGVWLRMYDFQVRGGYIRFNFEIWNKSGQDLFFSWSPNNNFSLVDNLDNRYEGGWTNNLNNEQVGNEERLQLFDAGSATALFQDDLVYSEGVTDLYLTIEYLSRIDKAVFHVLVGK